MAVRKQLRTTKEQEQALIVGLAQMKFAQAQGEDMVRFRQGFFTALILLTSEAYAQQIELEASVMFRSMTRKP